MGTDSHRQEGSSVDVDEGSVLCLACLDTIVIDNQDAGPLYREVCHFVSVLSSPADAQVCISYQYSQLQGQECLVPYVMEWTVRGVLSTQPMPLDHLSGQAVFSA